MNAGRSPHADPGYGDPNAPPGTPEWAKRWRLGFQNTATSLPTCPVSCRKFCEVGAAHRAWTLVTDREGRPFPDFDSFYACEKPYGLGMDPAKFRTYLVGELGENAAKMICNPVDGRKTRDHEEDGTFKPSDHSRNSCGNGSSISERTQQNIRAVLRAPEPVQHLYRDGLVNQKTAVLVGPDRPEPEVSAKIAEARKELESLDTALPKREFRKRAEVIVREKLDKPPLTALDTIRRLVPRLTRDERDALRQALDAEDRNER